MSYVQTSDTADIYFEEDVTTNKWAMWTVSGEVNYYLLPSNEDSVTKGTKRTKSAEVTGEDDRKIYAKDMGATSGVPPDAYVWTWDQNFTVECEKPIV